MHKIIGVILIIIALFFIFFYIVKKRKTAVINLMVLFIALIIFTSILEIILSFSIFHDITSDRPLWIPAKYRELNKSINYAHHLQSAKNKYAFNDINHALLKQNKNQLRIAILGDSFIWGNSVPDSIIWTRKLSERFKKDSIDCEIMNWGKTGWSTMDQFNFLQNEGIKYQFDYLVFTFVVNDPGFDPLTNNLVFPVDETAYTLFITPLQTIFPNVSYLIMDLTENFFATYFEYGGYNWYKNVVYSKENLKQYSDYILKIREYCKSKNISFSFILTPENHNPILGKYFGKIEKILSNHSIDYLNLYPNVKSDLKNYTIRQLWANPGDHHPGNLVTEVYIKYAYPFIRERVIPQKENK